MNIIIKHVFTKIKYLQRKKNFSSIYYFFLVHVYSKLARWGLLIVWDRYLAELFNIFILPIKKKLILDCDIYIEEGEGYKHVL